jgi:acetyltransferase-like isoleucine patch superfamily enzyme
LAPSVNIAGCVNIGANSFLGINSTIIDCINIEDHTTIAAGALVTKDLKGNQTYAGVPAKPFISKK